MQLKNRSIDKNHEPAAPSTTCGGLTTRSESTGLLRGLLGAAVLFTLVLWGTEGVLSAADQALMRFPTLHGDSIIFEASGNLWRVGRDGGIAKRLTTDKGYDQMPRFSPDGSLIAFTGEFDGNSDVYTMPAEGGPVTRLTYHSDVVPDAPLRWGPDNMVVTWTPDGKDILFLSRRDTFNSWFGRLYLIPRDGGMPTQLDVPKGGVTSFNADGTKIAYNRIFRNFRTWKDYYGGLAQDIWIYDLKTRAIDRVTDWKGTDTDPMWYKDRIYFVSDRGSEGRLNLWVYEVGKKNFRQITHFSDYDVDWPSLGDTGIVFQSGGDLYVVDLPSENVHKLSVDVPSDHIKERPHWVEAHKSIDSFGLAPNGKRALFGARGEVFTVPAQYGNTRDLTQTSGAREQYPSWSPDGMNVAYVTDQSGEAQLAMRAPNGQGGELVLTDRTKGYLYGPEWSPDSKKLAFSDSDHALWYFDISSHQTVKVDADPQREIRHYAWSPDGLWLTYSKAGENKLSDIYLYSLANGQATRVTTGNSNDYDPVFGADGKYLFFISDRHENPVFSESEFNIATLDMGGIYVMTLQASEASPFTPRSDEGAGEPSTTEVKKKESEQKPGAIEPITVDLEGLASRIVPLPIDSGNITHLASFGHRVYYLTMPNSSFGTTLSGETTLHFFDMSERKEHVLTHPLDQYDISADGKTLIYKNGADYYLSELTGDTLEPKPLNVPKMQAQIDPPEEWNEMFHQAWRLERDFFFNPQMNGVDWAAVQQKYEKLLPLVTCRQDLNYVIGEMLGELHNSHTYVGGGDVSRNDHVPTALLGVDFGLDAPSGRYYFKKIYPGDNSRKDYHSPLTEPGVDVKEGSYLLAVDGQELEAPTNPFSLFVNKVGKIVTLTVADNPQGQGRHDVTVRPVGDDLNLRLRSWIEQNRESVAKASGGKIGYIYLSDMEELGMNEFIRQFYPQIHSQGLIIDVRYNGGGFIDQIVLERLRRKLIGMTVNREGATSTIPEQVVYGPMACLINHYSASDGDIFPFYFRKYGLGPLIGTRTWGGVRGIRGYWPLADGGYITIPEESLYGLESDWIIENHGVEPDIEVDDLPGPVMQGHDPQLERAVQEVMSKIQANPPVLPKEPALSPAYPPEGVVHKQ